MDVALTQARFGLEADEVPIGAVAVLGDEVLAAAHWRLRPQLRLLAHPEALALSEAERHRHLGRRDRRRVELYTTLEPCLLCMGAAMSFLAGRVVYALEAPADGASRVAEVWRPALGHPLTGHPYAVPQVTAGVRRAESLALMQEFVARNPAAAWARTLVPGPK